MKLQTISSVAIAALAGLAQGDDLSTKNSPYRSRTDILPSSLNITKQEDGVSDEYIFIAPWSPGDIKTAQTYLGPHIFTSTGDLIWTGFGLGNSISNFQPFTQKGNHLMSYFEGNVANSGVGFGTYAIMNDHYKVIKRLGYNQGYLHDFHEFHVVDEDRAAFSTYRSVPYDMSNIDEFDGDEGWVFENIVTVVDMTNDKVTFEWKSLDHVPVTDTKVTVNYDSTGKSSSKPFDYLHLNAIDKDEQGNYLISCRHTWSLYYLDGKTGEIIWTLGSSEGDRNDWDLDDDAIFAYQHDARWVDPKDIDENDDENVRYISLFDNSQAGGAPENYRDYSRGLILKLDNSTGATDDDNKIGKVTVAKEFKLPSGIDGSTSQGNVQVLKNGNVFIGWGSNPMISEHKISDESIVFQATINDGEYASYRAFKAGFHGYPDESPAVSSVYLSDNNKTTVYMSLNGATEVDKWYIYSGNSTDSLLTSCDNDEGFEKQQEIDGKHDNVLVVAKNGNGTNIGKKKAQTFSMNSMPLQRRSDSDSGATAIHMSLASLFAGLVGCLLLL